MGDHEGSRSLVLPVCCLIVGLVAGSGEAADTTGELHGVVVDSEGIGLSGVRVAFSSEVLIGGVHEKTTGEDGRFNLRTLPPGSYLIRAELGGFGSVEVEAVVQLNRRTDLRIEMAATRFSDEITVEVAAEPVQMDITRVHVGETYNQEFLEVAAIGIDGRSVLGIIGKEAGVEGGARPRIMGSTYSENVFLIDGLNTTDPVLGTAYLEINFDALQEIAVHTGGFEAEYGHALGGVINAVTKSGGNNVTGTVDLRYRDPNLAESGEYFDPDRDPTSQFDRFGDHRRSHPPRPPVVLRKPSRQYRPNHPASRHAHRGTATRRRAGQADLAGGAEIPGDGESDVQRCLRRQ